MQKKIDLTKPIEYEIGGVTYTQGELTLEKAEDITEMIAANIEWKDIEKTSIKNIINLLIKKKLIGKALNILIGIPIVETGAVIMPLVSEVIGDFLALNENWIESSTSFLFSMTEKLAKNEKPIQEALAESLAKSPPPGLKNISEKSH